MRKCGRDYRPAARNSVDQDTGGDLIGGVVGQHNHSRGLDKRRQRRDISVAWVEGHRVRYPASRACSARASRYASPPAARTLGCVLPAIK